MKSLGKIALILLFLLGGKAYVQGQAALLVLIFGDRVASEKFHLSIDGGINLTNLPGITPQKMELGFNFGLGTFIKVNDKWALTPEFKPLSMKGASKVNNFNADIPSLNNPSTKLRLDYIDVPLLVQYKITKKIFVSAGPQISFLTSIKQITKGTLSIGDEISVIDNLHGKVKAVDWSFPIEVGYSIADAIGGSGIDIKFRYSYGFTNIFKDQTLGSSANSNFQIFLSFPFIKSQSSKSH